MATRDEIIKELESRGVDVSAYKKSDDTPSIPEKNLLPTPKQQVEEQGPYGGIIDDMEVPEENTRTKPINDYLTSPEFGRLALEITGGVVGAAFAPVIAPALIIGRAAALVRPALKLAVTRMAGAGIGEASGAVVSQTFSPTFNSKDDISEIFSSIAKDALKKGAIGATGEGAGQLIGKGISKVLSKNKKLLKGAEEAVETIEAQKLKIKEAPIGTYSDEIIDATKVGQLTPGLLQKGQTIDIFEGIAESSLAGGGSIRYAKEGAETIAQSGIDDFIKIYKTEVGEAELGVLFQKTLTDDLQVFKSVANAKYKALDDALASKKFANNFQVDLTNLKAFAREELANLGAKSESASLKKFLNGIIADTNYITFKRANILRGDYLEISRSFTKESLGKKKNRLSAIAAEEITKAMDNSPIPESTKNLLTVANKHYREGAEVFNDSLFKKIINNDPDLVYKAIVAAGDRPTLVKKTFEILNKRITDVTERNLLKTKIKGEFLEDVLFRSQVNNSQFGVQIDAGRLFSNFSKQQKTFEAMFSPSEIAQFKKFQNALSFAQGKKSKVGGLPGGMMIQMKQSGALIELGGVLTAGAGLSKTGAAILLGPALIAKAFTTPKIVKSLTLGFKYSDNPSLARRYFLQTMTHMAEDNLISDDELKNIKDEVKQSVKENAKVSKNNEPIISQENFEDTSDIDNIVGSIDNSELIETASLPTTAPLETQGINPANFNPKIMNQDASGLTSTETALLSPEEQAIRLRQRTA